MTTTSTTTTSTVSAAAKAAQMSCSFYGKKFEKTIKDLVGARRALALARTHAAETVAQAVAEVATQYQTISGFPAHPTLANLSAAAETAGTEGRERLCEIISSAAVVVLEAERAAEAKLRPVETIHRHARLAAEAAHETLIRAVENGGNAVGKADGNWEWLPSKSIMAMMEEGVRP